MNSHRSCGSSRGSTYLKNAVHFSTETHVTSKAKTIRSTDPTQPFDLEANKAIALRLVEVFNGRQLDLLEDVLHPEFHERGLSAFPPAGPEVGPDARRKLYVL